MLNKLGEGQIGADRYNMRLHVPAETGDEK